MKQKVITLIQDYIYELGEPRKRMRREYFRQKSYSIWAAEELLKRVSRSKKDPITVIEDFVRTTDRYSCVSDSASYMFSVAHDIAMDVLDRVLSIMERSTNE